MDEEVSRRFDAMEQRIDGGMFAITATLDAILDNPLTRAKVMKRLSDMLADQMFQEEAPRPFVDSLQRVVDMIRELEEEDRRRQGLN